jgi:hypothetical protein
MLRPSWLRDAFASGPCPRYLKVCVCEPVGLWALREPVPPVPAIGGDQWRECRRH